MDHNKNIRNMSVIAHVDHVSIRDATTRILDEARARGVCVSEKCAGRGEQYGMGGERALATPLEGIADGD